MRVTLRRVAEGLRRQARGRRLSTAAAVRLALAEHPRARAARAVPAGCRPADTQAEWFTEVLAHPDTAALRADAYGNLRAVAAVVRDWMDYATGLSRPTHAEIMRRTGLGRRTVTRWLAWLRERGFLGVAEPGSTPETRAGGSVDGLGNLAAEYVLTIPGEAGQAVEGDQLADVVPLRGGVAVGVSGAPSRDLSVRRDSRGRQSPKRGAQDQKFSSSWAWSSSPSSGRQRLAAARLLRAESLTLRRVPLRALAELLREMFDAGATPADVLHALDHRPDGSAWTHTDRPRHVPGWLRYRLAAWRGPDGEILAEALPSRLAADRAAAAARQAAAVAELVEQARQGRASDQAARAEAARARLAAASPASAEVIRRRAVRVERTGRDAAAYARLDALAAERLAPVAVEPESVFRAEVIERHALPAVHWSSEPEPAAGPDDPAAVAADRAWLVEVTSAARRAAG